jgi:hypothetical protein
MRVVLKRDDEKYRRQHGEASRLKFSHFHLPNFTLPLWDLGHFTPSMPTDIVLKPQLQLGVVTTHFKFVGGIVPDEKGKFPRDGEGNLRVLTEMKKLVETTRVKMTTVQISFFPAGDADEIKEMVDGLKALGLEVQFILMVGGANPMNPADEDAVVSQLVNSIRAAICHGIRHISSTSIEEWMSDDAPRVGADFEAAIAQNVKVHLRAYQEAGIHGSCIQNWHIEFLRPGEFKTFTNLDRGWSFVKAANLALGHKFFKLVVDAAHCGDSDLSIAENEALIRQIAAAGEFGIFHASAKTTRGCLSTDDGWIGALLTAAAKTGALSNIFVEVFDHTDAALESLRKLEPGHGVDTRDGRSYTQVTADGLADIARRLNNLHARGILKA